MPWKGVVELRWLRAALMAVVVSWIVIVCIKSHLSISVGGGLGLVNVQCMVSQRVQKRLIGRAPARKTKTPMPSEAERLRAWSNFAARTAFWLSFPMLFFMGRGGPLSVLKRHNGLIVDCARSFAVTLLA